MAKLTFFLFPCPVNIGNARLFGLETDLKLKGNEFQLAVSLLFVTYCVSFRAHLSLGC